MNTAFCHDGRGTGHVEPDTEGNVMTGRIVLIAVAVVAVGAFTVLQVMAYSRGGRPLPRPERRGRPRSRSGRHGRPGRRKRYRHDWRTAPPRYDDDAGPPGPPGSGTEAHGPLWRYGSPRGYSHDYGPGYRPGEGPAYPPPRRPS